MLIDAGILIRFAMEDDPDHLRITAKLRALVREEWDLCFAPQAIREAWNALTRPVANGGYDLSSEKTDEILDGA